MTKSYIYWHLIVLSDSLLVFAFVATRTEHTRRSRDMSARMEERMREAQAEVVQEKEDKRDISTGVYSR